MYLPWLQRFEKIFTHDSKDQEISQNTFIDHRIRSKISISLEIILNVFNCLIVSLVPLKFLL